VLRAYCRRRYQVALAAGGPRFDLNAQPCGEVAPEHIERGLRALADIDTKAAAAAAEIQTARKAEQAAAAPAADRAKGPRPHHNTQPEISAAAPPHVEPKPRLGLADLRRAFQERKAQAAGALP
jgi:sRNA-binding protein